MATQKGTIGAVFGIPSATSIVIKIQTGPPAVVAEVTYAVIRTYNYSREADSKEIRDADGDVINWTTYNSRERMTVDIIPDSTTLALALAEFNTCPAIGTEVDVVSTGETQADGSIAAVNRWFVEAASKVATQDDFAVISLTLVRWATDFTNVAAA